MEHKTPEIRLLDCTLRDGGYYNDWDFSLKEAQDYVDSLASGGVDIIEIGFRFTPKTKFLGPFAYTNEALLSRINLPDHVQFGVMINASDYLGDDWETHLDAAFVPEPESRVSLVRIAAHIGQVSHCDKIVAWLKDKGYDVGLNIMQISQASDVEIVALVDDIERRFVSFEALYFADSLGNLTTSDVTRIVELFKGSTFKPIGFHGHDNIGLGVANSMAAIAAGASWIDSTITGMGRGAGNTQTEYLTLELSRAKLKDFDLLDIQKAATGWLADLKKKCDWGTNIFYYEAGLRSLHPSYVQQMLSSKRYEPIDILVMILALSEGEKPTSYREANIADALSKLMQSSGGSDQVDGLWKDRPVLFVASGPHARRHWSAISKFANDVGAIKVAINHLEDIPTSDLDAVICIHPARMMALLNDSSWNTLPLFTATGALPQSVSSKLKTSGTKVIDFGVSVANDAFAADTHSCVIPAPVVLGYAWAVAETAGASQIYLAGFDGHDGKSDAFVETEGVLKTLRAHSSLPVSSVTSTYFDVDQAAIYASMTK